MRLIGGTTAASTVKEMNSVRTALLSATPTTGITAACVTVVRGRLPPDVGGWTSGPGRRRRKNRPFLKNGGLDFGAKIPLESAI